MKFPDPRGKICKVCKKQRCEYYCYCCRMKDAMCCYEPNDYEEGDIGSATVAEVRKQNGDY